MVFGVEVGLVCVSMYVLLLRAVPRALVQVLAAAVGVPPPCDFFCNSEYRAVMRVGMQAEEARTLRGAWLRKAFCSKRAWLGGGGLVEGELTLLESQCAVDLVKAIVLSQIGSHAALRKLLAAEWVAGWDGWNELENNATEEMCMAIASRLLRLSGEDENAVIRTDDERLQELEQERLFQSVASAHGRNNCLIDSLILCLCAAGDLPKHLAGDVRQRKGLVDACRAMLVAAVGSGAGDLDAGHFPYLDAERDAAFIIRFLLDEFDARVRNYILIVHDRFGHGGADPERGIVHIELRDDMEGDCAELHVYNHTDGRGCGYHFDALLSAQLVTPSPSIALQPANAPRAKAAVPVSVLQPAWDRDRATRALHSFITKRCSGVHVNEADIAQLHCNWDATDALGQQIQTLLSAGNVYMERGLHNARYVARTFRAWYNMMPAEAGEMRGYTLGKAPPATEKTTQGTPNYARQQQADAAHSPTPGGPVQAKIDHVSNGGDRTQRKRCSPGKKGAKTRVPRGEDSAVKKQAASKNKKQHKRHLLGTTERKGLERKRKAHRGQGSRGKGKPAPETSQPLLKRLTGKQPDPRQSMDEEEQLPDIYAMHVLTSGPGNDDPRAAREAFIRAIASLLVRKPTLPERFQWVSGNELGFDLPNAHCAFGGCGWEGDTEAELGHHLVTRHRAELQEPHQEAWNPEKVASHLVATYEKAVTWVCQSAAPVAARSSKAMPLSN